MTSPTPSYAERLRIPLRWWAVLTMFLGSALLAFLVALPVWLAFSTIGGMFLLAAGLLTAYGAARVEVAGPPGEEELRAGRARVPVRLLGVPVALDGEAGRRAAGVDADARAYLLLRPYLTGSVRVPVTDPADPTPYWLVSSRRPGDLVTALEAARRRTGA